MMANPDVVIMATKKNIETLKMMIPYVKQNISNGNIYIVASGKIRKSFTMIMGIKFCDEDTVVDGMTFDSVASLMEKASGSREKTGWYFQQFLKLGWAQNCKGEYYIVIDADTFPLNRIEFEEEGKYLFTQKVEYNKPYFDTINTLFDGCMERQGNFSFVAEHMAFDCSVVKKMTDEIVERHPEKGTTFYEVIINSVNKGDLLGSGFSEFETYGTYIFSKYPDIVRLRKLRTLREAAYIIGGKPTIQQLAWAAKDYDIISIEVPEYGNTFITTLTKSSFIRKVFHANNLAYARKKTRSIYRKMIRKKDFTFD